MKIKKRQAGFGLLELMLSMVIVALLLIMATRYYQSARSNARVNQAVSLVGTIVSSANNISIGTGGYTNVSTANVLPYLPVSAQGDKNTINSPWQTEVDVAAVDKTNYTITFNNLPVNDCLKLSDALGGSGNTDKTVGIDSTACKSGTLKITEYYVNAPKS